ncbi:MAG: metallopeptidase [Cyclobacteriaceae bacterium]|nr:MAG: metallopeptidase [Cyclobacteriaceae bacterium]
MQTPDQIRQLLAAKIPQQAVPYCESLWHTWPFSLKLAGSRTSKAGDFTVRNNRLCISVNRNLNPYLFLFTLIHEIAHAVVYRQYGRKVSPHGREWKNTFSGLMAPLLVTKYFPQDLLGHLQRHLQNPAASSSFDLALTRCFRKYDLHPDGFMLLADLPQQALFRLQQRWFIKGPLRRSRYACQCVRTQRIYLVPGQALVSVAQLPLFA